VYSLNRDHIAVSDILVPLLECERDLMERYVRDLRKQMRTPTEAIVLFGSVARQEEQPRSDVDLLLIARDRTSAKAASRQVDDATTGLLARYGSVPQILVSDVGTFRNKLAHGDPLYGEILRTGRVVYGKSFARLLRHGSQEDQHAKRGASRVRRSLA
jgi:predicted nucleotidyltransferase